MGKYILGISAYYHDSAAVLLKDGVIEAAAQEERFTRKKHDPGFPEHAVKFVLKKGNVQINDLECVAFYDKPRLKFKRLMETYFAYAPKGFESFQEAYPAWAGDKLHMEQTIKEKLGIGATGPKFFFPEHHLSHAASAFYPSPFQDAAILTIDGVGEWTTTSLGKGEGARITSLKEIHFPHSLGLLYSAFTAFCGFRVNSGEYKLMGLAPYGDPESKRTQRFKDCILDQLLDLRFDGSFYLNMDYFNYTTGLTMCKDEKWEKLFGIPKRKPESELGQEHMDMALAIQQVTEDIVLKLASTLRDLTGLSKLVMAGGVALNCVANGKLLRAGVYDDIWIQPAAGDAGGALGAALAANYIAYDTPRTLVKGDSMQGAYLGPDFKSVQIEEMASDFKAVYKRTTGFNELCSEVADIIADGNVVGWFQGRMEYGPRALGNRSIIADPRNPGTQKHLNLKIKYREGFRPFAPSVLEESIEDYFELDRSSPYMLIVSPVVDAVRKDIPKNYSEMGMYDRLYVQRSSIPAVTHVDFSARIQSVSKKTNERYWTLINTFKERHGCGLLVNTSFNVRGEPIVCTPAQAYACFMRTEMDYLVLNDCIFNKSEQPAWSEDSDWREEFELD